MTTMIERVAKAIQDAGPIGSEYIRDGDAIRLARAAIEAYESAAVQEIAALRAENDRLRGLLCLADEAIVAEHGCFPLDRANSHQIFMNDAAKAIRTVTGDDYVIRKDKAKLALDNN